MSTFYDEKKTMKTIPFNGDEKKWAMWSERYKEKLRLYDLFEVIDSKTIIPSDLLEEYSDEDKVLRDKIEKQEMRIMELSMRLKKEEDTRMNKFTLTSHDKKVLNAIRKNKDNVLTSSERTNVDNRFRGSANSRRQARNIHRRG